MSATNLRLLLLGILLVSLSFGSATAQYGSISGTVLSSEDGNPIPGANVVVVSADSQFFGAATNSNGYYLIAGLPVSTFRLTASFIGFADAVFPGITLGEGQPRRIDVNLTPTLVYEDEVIVTSVSRRVEKAVDAPAGVSVLEPREVVTRTVLTVGEHVKGMPAVDAVSTGLVQSRIAVRGFNNVIDNTDGLLLLTDYRNASFPSVRLNMFQLVPTINEDVERIEVVRGPGSALYGPNAANGVMHIVTKSPFASRGTHVTFGLGEREVITGSLRHAGVIGENLGYKISGRYFQGKDWEYDDPAEPDSIVRGRHTPVGRVDENGLVSNERNNQIDNGSVDGRIDYEANEDLTFTLSGGWARTTSINQTVAGAAIYEDAVLAHIRAQAVYKDLFFQTFWNKGNLEDGYLLRTGDQIIEKSSTLVGQIQHRTSVAGDKQRFTYGGDVFLTRPNTEFTLNGRNEDEDDVTEIGGYVQSETQVHPKVKLVAALRADKHSQISDLILSPRAALLFSPAPSQSLRLTYNRAFTTPANPSLFLDLHLAPSLGPLPYPIRGLGLPSTGFNYRRDDSGGADGLYMQSPFNPAGPDVFVPAEATSMWGAVVAILAQQGIDISGIPGPTPADVGTQLALLNTGTEQFDPVDAENIVNVRPPQPTTTNTVEVGYKGLVGSKMFFTLDGYYLQAQDRISPLSTMTPSAFLDEESLADYLLQFMSEDQAAGFAHAIAQIPLGTVTPDEAGAVAPAAIVLSYRNYDESISLWGADASFTYVANEQWRLRGAYSFVSEDLWPAQGNQLTDIALNAPRHKASASVLYYNARQRVDAQARFRYVHSFPMRSGVYVGDVDAYTVFDVTVGWGIPGVPQSKLTLTVQNVLDNKHQEFVGGAEIGRLAMVELSTSL